MSSATGPQPQGTCAYPLQGFGAWALEERDNADCDKIKRTKISVEVLGDPGRESTVKHSSAGSEYRRGQESHSSVELHRDARDLERPSRYTPIKICIPSSTLMITSLMQQPKRIQPRPSQTEYPAGAILDDPVQADRHQNTFRL
jgi:hypothetical protein